MLFIYFCVAIAGSAGITLYSKYVLKNASPHAFSLLTNLIGALIYAPIAISNISFTNTREAWFAVLAASLFWAIAALLSAASIKKTEVSVRAPLSQSKMLWTVLFSVLILGEAVTLWHLIAVLIIFLGISILLWHPEYKFGSLKDPGIRLIFASAVMSAVVAIADKYALGFFSIELYAFFVFLFPAATLALFTPNKGGDVKDLWKAHKWGVLAVSLLMIVAYYAVLKVYSSFPISVAYPLLQLSTVVTVMCGIFFLKERDHLGQKVIATFLVIAGSILLKLT